MVIAGITLEIAPFDTSMQGQNVMAILYAEQRSLLDLIYGLAATKNEGLVIRLPNL